MTHLDRLPRLGHVFGAGTRGDNRIVTFEQWSWVASIVAGVVTVIGFPVVVWQLHVGRQQRLDAVRLSTSQVLLAVRDKKTQCHLAYFRQAAVRTFPLVRTGFASFMVAGASCRVPRWPGFLTG